MVVPYVPLELVEEIVDVLGGDTKSLLSCSLVSIGWVHRSRRHLFAAIKLHSSSDIQSWFGTGLATCSGHVRSLDLAQNEESKWIVPETLTGKISDFTSFHNVQTLTMTGLDLTLFNEHSLTRSFGHLSDRLTSLSVKDLTAHPHSLLFFVCMFPKLDNLKIDHLTPGETSIPYKVPTVTPRFRGNLSLSHIKINGSGMLAPFLDPPLPMAFEDVRVVECRFENPKPLKDLFAACQTTMKRVHVSKIFLDDISETPLIDLSPCGGLEEMRLSLIQLRQPSHWIEPILRTVTSTRVRKITFDTDFPTAATDLETVINLPSWSTLDATFLRMARALDPIDEKLEVVFHALTRKPPVDPKPVDPGRFLEGCRTKATVSFQRA